MWNFLCWKMWYVLTDVFSGSCLIFFFYTVAHFHLVGRLFSFSHRHFHVFPPTKFVSCFFSNALALLLMSLKTLKFSRTWLCCWFFSLLSPDGLSLSKKLGWILVFPKKKSLCCICHTCWLSYFTFSGMPVMRKGVRTLKWLFMHSEPKFLSMVYRCGRESSPKMFVVNQDVKKRQNRPL